MLLRSGKNLPSVDCGKQHGERGEQTAKRNQEDDAETQGHHDS